MSINASAENYLETILLLSKKLIAVRSIDIVHELDFKKSSVSVAMKNLRLNGYITVTDEGFILLTPSGLAIAESVYERHEVIADFLRTIGVEDAIALEDACKLEHILSDASFHALKAHLAHLTAKK